MIAFHVQDMTCGHCVRTITTALQRVDAGATVVVDLATHQVQVEPATADATALADAIRQAGYTPVAAAPAAVQAGAPARACCGCK